MSTSTVGTPLRQPCRRAGSPLSRSIACARMPPFLAAPRARFAWHLGGFVTSSRESCGLVGRETFAQKGVEGQSADLTAKLESGTEWYG